MRFLVDASSGMAVVRYLREIGHDVAAVAEMMPHAPDHEILVLAVDENRILITNDKDFGELIYRNGLNHAGVLFLRPRDENPSSRVSMLEFVLNNHSSQLPGSFVVVTEDRVRIRHK
jgi:predicted nuclease of predicted toxin-antitoxin system